MNLSHLSILNDVEVAQAFSKIAANFNPRIGRAMINADRQPLFKDTGIIDKPMDTNTAITAQDKNVELSHLQDRRVLNKGIKKVKLS